MRTPVFRTSRIALFFIFFNFIKLSGFPNSPGLLAEVICETRSFFTARCWFSFNKNNTVRTDYYYDGNGPAPVCFAPSFDYSVTFCSVFARKTIPTVFFDLAKCPGSGQAQSQGVGPLLFIRLRLSRLFRHPVYCCQAYPRSPREISRWIRQTYIAY